MCAEASFTLQESTAFHFISMSRSNRHAWGLALWVCSLAWLSCGCHILQPRPIAPALNNLPPQLTVDQEMQLERGEPRPIIDAIGWVWGIPSKIVLWNRRVENHHISAETEAMMVDYLACNGLEEVKVRLNQYRPLDDWRRLTRNTSVAWPWRYTFGLVTVLGETLVPGRVFGGDHYNPYTATIHLYSDVPAIAFHEAAHAKDFSRRRYPGTYAAVYALPGVPLWHESIATNDVLAYVDGADLQLKRETYNVLLPAYSTYLGGAIGSAIPDYSTPIYYGTVLLGHFKARMRSRSFLPRM